MSNGSFDWDWKYVCPTGLTPWMPDKNQLSPCFQQICLQFPVLVIFLVVSTFYFANEAILVRRNGTQICLIYLRCLVSFLFALIPFYDLQSKLSNQIRVWPIDILLAGTQLFTWMIHLGICRMFLLIFHYRNSFFFNRILLCCFHHWKLF